MNIGFRLEYIYGQSDIKCPHCNQGFDVKWDSEYGYPNIGEHEVTCAACEKDFHFSVYNQYNSNL